MKIIINKSRGNTARCEINNLIENKKFILGDNHRFAPWYWAQLTNGNKSSYDLIHIDHHFDDDTYRIDDVISAIQKPHQKSIKEFLNANLKKPDVCAVNFQNIISYYTKINTNFTNLFINEGAINRDSNLPFEKNQEQNYPHFLVHIRVRQKPLF